MGFVVDDDAGACFAGDGHILVAEAFGGAVVAPHHLCKHLLEDFGVFLGADAFADGLDVESGIHAVADDAVDEVGPHISSAVCDGVVDGEGVDGRNFGGVAVAHAREVDARTVAFQRNEFGHSFAGDAGEHRFEETSFDKLILELLRVGSEF